MFIFFSEYVSELESGRSSPFEDYDELIMRIAISNKRLGHTYLFHVMVSLRLGSSTAKENLLMVGVSSSIALMLLSHCGEYMANGLTNAVRHEFVMIANDRQTFVAVRKHSRSFLWCFECYAGLTSGECMANGLTNAIRHQFAMIAK